MSTEIRRSPILYVDNWHPLSIYSDGSHDPLPSPNQQSSQGRIFGEQDRVGRGGAIKDVNLGG